MTLKLGIEFRSWKSEIRSRMLVGVRYQNLELGNWKLETSNL
jgi:hypothetical protein